MRQLALLPMVAGALAAFLACTSQTSTVEPPAATSQPVADAGQQGALLEGGPQVLDAGGPLTAPFTCPIDDIQNEPRPAKQVLELLRVAAGLDSLQERVATAGDAGPDGGSSSLFTAGVPCSSATDVPACELAFAQLSSGGEALYPAFDEGEYVTAALAGGKPSGHYLAHTKGAAVGKLSSSEELRALFPAVDAPAKAVLFAHAAGYRVECHLAGWFREETDGYVIIASRGHEARCSRVDVVLFVRRDGSTEERHLIENQPDRCT